MINEDDDEVEDDDDNGDRETEQSADAFLPRILIGSTTRTKNE